MRQNVLQQPVIARRRLRRFGGPIREPRHPLIQTSFVVEIAWKKKEGRKNEPITKKAFPFFS